MNHKLAQTVAAFAALIWAGVVPAADPAPVLSEQACRRLILSVAIPQPCLWHHMSMTLSDAPAVARTDQPADEKEPLQWSTRLSTSAWSSNRRLDELEGIGYAQALGHLNYKWSASVALLAEGYVDREEAPGSEEDHSRARIREAYARFRSGNLTLSMGPQIIGWGRADVINPTDNVSARDYTLLVPSDADQKLGVTTANLVYRSGSMTFQALAQGAFRPDRIPLPDVAGAHYITHRPDRGVSSYGAKIDWSGDQISWSASVLSGAMKRPNLRLDPSRVAQGILDLNYPDAVIYGADFEVLVGNWILRGESAYSDVEGSGRDAFASRESSLFTVLGIERDFGSVSGFLQAVHKHTFDFVDQTSISDVTLRTLAESNAILNEETRNNLPGVGAGMVYRSSDLTWNASMDILAFPSTGELAVRPRIQYRATDNVLLSVGGDSMHGRRTGPVGRLGENTSFFAGISWSR